MSVQVIECYCRCSRNVSNGVQPQPRRTRTCVHELRVSVLEFMSACLHVYVLYLLLIFVACRCMHLSHTFITHIHLHHLPPVYVPQDEWLFMWSWKSVIHRLLHLFAFGSLFAHSAASDQYKHVGYCSAVWVKR